MRPLFLVSISLTAISAGSQPAAAQGPPCGAEPFTASNAGNDGFGEAIALDGDHSIIGAPRANDQGQNSGAAHVLRRSATTATWTEEDRLVPSVGSANARFGVALDLATDLALVGAPSTGTSAPGRAFVYRWNAATARWDEEAALLPAASAAGDEFGTAVAFAGGSAFAFAGAPQAGVGGVVHVFRYAPASATWIEVQQLVAPNGTAGDHFGQRLATSGERVVIGAPGDDMLGTWAGSAYTFVRDPATSQWLFEQQLWAASTVAYDAFGWLVALDGDRLVAYSFGPVAHTDQLHTFARDPLSGAWSEQQELAASAGAGPLYATGLALDGPWLVTGGAGFNVVTGDDRGHVVAYAWTPASASWELTHAAAFHGGLGYALDLDRGRVAVTDYFYWTDRTQAFELIECVGAGQPYCPQANNSTGRPARLRAGGSTDAASGALILLASNLPANQFGYFLVGQAQGSSTPLGSQGMLCLANPIARFNRAGEILFSGASGHLELSVDKSAVPLSPPVAIQPGETWHFQGWFRDANPGPTSNFTTGVSVSFL